MSQSAFASPGGEFPPNPNAPNKVPKATCAHSPARSHSVQNEPLPLPSRPRQQSAIHAAREDSEKKTKNTEHLFLVVFQLMQFEKRWMSPPAPHVQVLC